MEICEGGSYGGAMSSADAELSIASRLCLACGMCCDGTVYGVARLDREEIPKAVARGFRPCTAPNGSDAFDFPCSHLDGKACTIYDQWRPQVCGDYFCALQDRVKANEMTEAQALETIAATLKSRDQLREVLPPDETLAQARQRFETVVKSGGTLDPQDARTAVKLFVLEKMLDRHFRKSGEERLRETARGAPAISRQ